MKRTIQITGAGVALLLAMLACTVSAENLRIEVQPRYVCPSATPRLTDTPQPTNPPTYPMGFIANLDFYHVDVTRSAVTVQYLAQGVGTITLSYNGYTTSGLPWNGSGGVLSVASAPAGMPGFAGSYPISIPPDVAGVNITVVGTYAYTFHVVRYLYPYTVGPNAFPCCLSAPIFPTPAPTYTPYPTPTPYERTDDYFVGDPVYALGSTLRVRFRLIEVSSQPATELDKTGNPQNVYVWRVEVKNVGSTEYTLFPAAQMYIAEIRTGAGESLTGVWGASTAAARAAGLTHDYAAVGLLPGQAQVFTLAAFGPVGIVYRLSYAMDTSARGDGPTQVPGRNIVSWLNEPNTVCKGEIQEP